jgi:hypothetical protein
MYWQYDMSGIQKQAGRHLSAEVGQRLLRFVAPLLENLDARIDKRLIRTLLETVMALLMFRDRAKTLVLSE